MVQRAQKSDSDSARSRQVGPDRAAALAEAQAREATRRARNEAALAQANSMADAGDMDGAIACLMALIEVDTPSVHVSRRLMWLLMRQRRGADAAAVLERLKAAGADRPLLKRELVLLELEYRLFTQELDQLEALADAAAADYPDHEGIRVARMMALLMCGRQDEALALLNAAPPIGERALAQGMRLFHLLDLPARLALTDALLAQPGGPAASQLRQLAHLLMQDDRPSDALALIERAEAADPGAVGAQLRLVAAKAACLAGQREVGARHLAHAFGEAYPRLVPLAADTLVALLRGLISENQLCLSLAAHNPKVAPQLGPGWMPHCIDEYLARPAAERYGGENPIRDFFRFAVACNEMKRLDLLRAEIAALPEGFIFHADDLRRLTRFPGLIDHAATRAIIHRQLSRCLDPLSSDGVLYRLMLLPPGPELEAAARDCLEHLESGRRAWDLRFFLAEEWSHLAGLIEAPAVLRGLERQVAHVFDPAQEATNLSIVAAQRHLVETILGGLPPAAPASVSIVTPCHRPSDLENLRRCVSWQSWPDLELVVVANGPLCGNPAVAEALAGLPNLTILHSEPSRVGHYLNRALEASSGDFVLRFDSDDLYFEDYATNAVRLMQAFGADIAGQCSMFFHSEKLARTFFSQRGNYLSVRPRTS